MKNLINSMSSTIVQIVLMSVLIYSTDTTGQNTNTTRPNGTDISSQTDSPGKTSKTIVTASPSSTPSSATNKTTKTLQTTTITSPPPTATTEQDTTTTEIITTESVPDTTTLLFAATTNSSSPTPPPSSPSSITTTTPTSKLTTESIVKSVSTTPKISVTDYSTVGYTDNSASVTNSSESNTTSSYATNLVTSTSSGETYLAVNGSCLLGFVLQKDKCVYLCKDRICENDGVCTVETDTDGKRSVAMCRCKQDDDVEYSGDNCEVSKPSRLKERKITLGVLIPVVCILLLILTCTCVKLRRRGKTARDLKNNYDLNSGAL